MLSFCLNGVVFVFLMDSLSFVFVLILTPSFPRSSLLSFTTRRKETMWGRVRVKTLLLRRRIGESERLSLYLEVTKQYGATCLAILQKHSFHDSGYGIQCVDYCPRPSEWDRSVTKHIWFMSPVNGAAFVSGDHLMPCMIPGLPADRPVQHERICSYGEQNFLSSRNQQKRH